MFTQRLSHLEVLDATNCNDLECIVSIVKNIPACIVRLSRDFFTPENYPILLKSIPGNLSNLEISPLEQVEVKSSDIDKCEHLEEFSLLACAYRMDVAHGLRFPNLQVLSLQLVDFTSPNSLFTLIQSCIHIQKLSMISCTGYNVNELSSISSLKNLEIFGIENCDVTDAVLASLPFESLANLTINVSNLSPHTLSDCLLRATKLECLMFGAQVIDDEHLISYIRDDMFSLPPNVHTFMIGTIDDITGEDSDISQEEFDTLTILVARTPSLKKFHVGVDIWLPNLHSVNVAHMEHLESLSLSFPLQTSCIQQILNSCNNLHSLSTHPYADTVATTLYPQTLCITSSSLRRLRLSFVKGEHQIILGNSPNLKEIQFSQGHLSITIAGNCPKLQEIDLFACTVDVAGLFKSLNVALELVPSLKKLGIPFAEDTSPSDIYNNFTQSLLTIITHHPAEEKLTEIMDSLMANVTQMLRQNSITFLPVNGNMQVLQFNEESIISNFTFLAEMLYNYLEVDNNDNINNKFNNNNNYYNRNNSHSFYDDELCNIPCMVQARHLLVDATKCV